MKSIRALGALIALSATTAFAANVVVSPGNMNGWAFYETDSSGIIGTGSGTGNLVNGPATPPLGTGSAHLQTPTGGGDQSVQLRTANFAGTKLSDISQLSYSTYATAWNGQQVPYLTLWIDTNNDGIKDDRIWFEPDYSSATAGNSNPYPTQPHTALNLWQTWDARHGMWYDDNGLAGPGSNAESFDALAASLGANATIVNDSAQNIGGFRIVSGFASPGDTFDANVDALSITTTAGGTTTYNFEATVVPLPTAAWGGIFLLGGLAAFRLTRRMPKL